MIIKVFTSLNKSFMTINKRTEVRVYSCLQNKPLKKIHHTNRDKFVVNF